MRFAKGGKLAEKILARVCHNSVINLASARDAFLPFFSFFSFLFSPEAIPWKKGGRD